MKTLFTLLLFLSVSLSSQAEWLNVNHPDTANIEVIGNRGDTLLTFQKDRISYVTTDFGINWRNFTTSSPSFLYGVAITREGNLVISYSPMGIALKISTDCGETFNYKIIINDPGYGSEGLFNVNSRYICAKATLDWEHAYEISNDGITFFRIKNPQIPFWSINNLIIFNNFIIIYKVKDTLYRTVNINNTNTVIDNPGISELGLCEENSKGKLYMLVHDSVFTSIDSGWTWQRLNLNITGLIYLNIDNQDNIYLRTDKNIYCSYDDGLNWTDITENLPLTTCKYQELRFSDNKIFVRADDGNIYYRDIITVVNDNTTEVKEITIYPNPVSDYLFIQNQNFNHNKIIISSIIGETLINLEVDNKIEQKINIQSLSSGIYFLRIGNVCKKFIVNR